MLHRRLAVILCAVVAVLPVACAAPPASPSLAPTLGTVSAPPATPAPPSRPPAGTIAEVRADAPRTVPGETAVAEATDVVAGDRKFALRLYDAIRTETGNIFLSPYSISTALSMVYAGAGGTTADELAAALGVDVPEAWHAGRNAIDTDLTTIPEVDPSEAVVPLTIEPTNAMFGQAGMAWEPDYLDVLARSYGAGVNALDFAADPEAARAAINRWVNDRTHDRIEELLPPLTISEMTRFVLVNAIFFKATWAQPFEKASTKPEPFHRLDGSSVTVPLMHGDVRGNYARGSGWQAVSIPYVNADMLVIVPDPGRFAAVEGRLDEAFFGSVVDHLEWADLTLTMPKWTSSSSFQLIPVLRKLGVNALFDAADLSGMAPDPLLVSAVIHQANVTVDEAGTEAAAATAVVGDTTGGGPDVKATIRIDRPFIYAIRSSRTGEILFLGRVVDPAAG